MQSMKQNNSYISIKYLKLNSTLSQNSCKSHIYSIQVLDIQSLTSKIMMIGPHPLPGKQLFTYTVKPVIRKSQKVVAL